jgi:hypothetical protein
MKKGIIIGSLAILLIMIGFYNYTQSKMSVSDIIEKAVINYLNQGLEADFFKEKEISKLSHFKEKFEQENFTHYRTEAFQPDNESKVYFMLIVEPDQAEERGIVLYMTFDLKKEYPIEINELIISNWVIIEYEAKQF